MEKMIEKSFDNMSVSYEDGWYHFYNDDKKATIFQKKFSYYIDVDITIYDNGILEFRGMEYARNCFKREKYVDRHYFINGNYKIHLS